MSIGTANMLLTKPEVAERLRTSVRNLEKLIARGEIPVITVGSRVRIDESDLDAYIEMHRTSGRGHGPAA